MKTCFQSRPSPSGRGCREARVRVGRALIRPFGPPSPGGRRTRRKESLATLFANWDTSDHGPPLQYGLMTVVILTVHDVGAPWKQPDILCDFLERLRLGIDNDDRVLGRIRKIDLLILRISGGRLKIDVDSNADAA